MAAALVQRAIGDRLTCRLQARPRAAAAGERAQVQRDFVAATGANLVTVDAADTFLEALSGVSNPEGKRRSSGASSFGRSRARCGDAWATILLTFWCRARCLPDVVGPAGAHTDNIKSHHDVGGLPDDLKSQTR